MLGHFKTHFHATFKAYLKPCIWLTVYLWLIFFFTSFANNEPPSLLSGIIWLICSALASVVLFGLFGKMICKIRLTSTSKYSLICFFIATFITLALFTLYFLGQYPGGMSYDTITQYQQAIGASNYSNWHPVMHTLLFFTLPLSLGAQYGTLVYLQIVYFCLAFGYLIYVLRMNSCPFAFLLMLCLFVWVNPALITHLMYPWKDIGFMIFAMVIMSYYIQIILSDGRWLGSWRNRILFSVMIVACSYMRHNGILFVAPLFIITMLYSVKNNRIRLTTISLVITTILAVQISFLALQVSAPDKRIIETTGLPATVWCSVMQTDHDALPKATQDAMYSIATQEQYDTLYIPGNFNSIKSHANVEAFDNLTYSQVLKYTVQCFNRCPNESWAAVSKLTALVWGLDCSYSTVQVTISNNDYGIAPNPLDWASEFTRQTVKLFSSGISKIILGSYGLYLLLLLFIGLSLTLDKRASVIHIAPLFLYDFGTMLLLSGPDYRFFVLNLPLWLPTLFIMLRDIHPRTHENRHIIHKMAPKHSAELKGAQ